MQGGGSIAAGCSFPGLSCIWGIRRASVAPPPVARIHLLLGMRGPWHYDASMLGGACRPGRKTAFSIALHSHVTTIGSTGFNLETRVSR